MLLCGAGSAAAQALSLEFHDGRVRLTAENVPVSRILAEWARVGGTKIVNGERVPGAPLTLQIVDIPEQQALDTILRGAAGYMVLARDTTATGASAFDKILVLPTTSRAPAAPLPQPVAQPPQFPNRPVQEQEPVEIEEADENPQAPVPPPGFPRGRLPAPNSPNSLPPVPERNAVPDRNADDPAPNAAPAPTPGNPFGIVPGTGRPGTINPPPPRDPNEGTPR